MIKKNHKYYFIYLTENLINHHYYIGFHATNNLNDGYKGSGTLLKRKIKEYRVDNFLSKILEFINPDEWGEKEKFWIEKMRSHVKYGNGYNLTLGGEGVVGKIVSAETKQKISKVTAGENNPMYNYQYTKEQIKNFKKINSGKNNPRYGKNISEEHKNKISIANKGRIKSLEEKEKIRQYHLGKNLSEETKRKLSEIGKGRKLSEETKQKMKKPKTEEHKQKMKEAQIKRYKKQKELLEINIV
jgi:group I intron endonuclease